MDDKDVWAVTHAHSARTSPSIEGQELSSSLAENSALPQRSPSQAFLYDDLGANWGSPAAEETIEAEGLHSLPGLDPAAVDQSNESKTEAVSPAVAPPSALAQTFSKTSPTKDHGDDKDEVEEFADFEDENHDSRTSNRSRAAAAQDQLEAKDDDFDDFGYFPDEVAEQAGNADFGDDAFGDDAFGDAAFDEGRRGTDWWDQKPPTASFAGVSTPDWQPLQIRDANGAIASVEALSQQISAILSAPLSPGGPTNPFGKAATSELTPDAVRQVEGVSQVLASESSRKLLADLSRQPQLKPVDWLRSRTRKDLYISLGVPINLDELQTAGSSSSKLPPLSLTLDFGVSREPGPTSAPALDSTGLRRAASGQFSSSASPGSIAATRSGSATGVFTLKRSDSTDAARKQRVRERRLGDLGLEPTPEVDMRRLEEVCALTEGKLWHNYTHRGESVELTEPSSALPTVATQISSHYSRSRACDPWWANWRIWPIVHRSF